MSKQITKAEIVDIVNRVFIYASNDVDFYKRSVLDNKMWCCVDEDYVKMNRSARVVAGRTIDDLNYIKKELFKIIIAT